MDCYGFLIHLYYGKKIQGEMDYLLTFADRGFSGNPYDTGLDRTYSMDALPQEYPCMGNGDYRSSALVVQNENGAYSCDLRYKEHKLWMGICSSRTAGSLCKRKGGADSGNLPGGSCD